MASKDKAVNSLTSGIEYLFKKYKVDYLPAEASFVEETTLEIRPIDNTKAYNLAADNIIIATGSEPTPFPGIEVDEKVIVTSTGALELEQVPKRLAIIGGGIIGLEMASVYARIGSEVTIIEFQDAIGASMDAEVSKLIQKILTKQGLIFKTGTKVLSGVKENDIVNVEVEDVKTGKKETLEADILLVAIGRRPYTTGLNIENIGLETDKKGRLIIQDQYKTSKFDHIRVIGDVTVGAMLAHKAEEEGIAVVEYIHEGIGHVNYDNIPSVMYTFPEVAWTGFNEQQLKDKGIKYNVGKFPFVANSRAKTNNETEGFVKILADSETQKVLGVHIIGPNAGEMIAEAGLALEYGASAEDIARTCHAHPTLSEAFKEAAMAAYDKPIHI